MITQATLKMFAIVCPAVFMAGFIDAIAGGGGMVSLPAYLFSGVTSHNSIATNKMSSAIGTAVSTYRFCKNGYVDYIFAIPTVICSLIGSVIGARLALLAGDMVLKIFLLITLPIVAFLVFRNKEFTPKKKRELKRSTLFILGSILSFIIGIYDGFYGPGTGTFSMLAFTLILGFDVKTAAGNVKLCNLASNIAALIVFLIHKEVIIVLGLVAGVFSIAGHYTGASMVMKKGVKVVRPIILTVITLLYIKIVYEAFIK